MEKQFVTYKIALKLKELGFDEECLTTFDHEVFNIENFGLDNYTINSNLIDSSITAPLWQQVIDWLRETYKINILIAPIYSSENLKGYVFNFGLITMDNLSEVFKNGKFETFYKAREQAILKAIELCQK